MACCPVVLRWTGLYCTLYTYLVSAQLPRRPAVLSCGCRGGAVPTWLTPELASAHAVALLSPQAPYRPCGRKDRGSHRRCASPQPGTLHPRSRGLIWHQSRPAHLLSLLHHAPPLRPHHLLSHRSLAGERGHYHTSASRLGGRPRPALRVERKFVPC